MSNGTVSVKLLDKEFQVACPEGQEEALLASARHLDQQMRGIRSSGKVIGMERIAIMAALNLSNELLQQNAQSTPSEEQRAQVRSMNQCLDEALQRFSQLEIS